MKLLQRATAWSLALACMLSLMAPASTTMAEVKPVGDGTAAKNYQTSVIIDPITGQPASFTITGGGTTVKATAAAPSFVEGSTSNQLSSDLSGGLRISGTISATTTTKSTAADPTQTEGATNNAISSDLAGYIRTAAKQIGTWTVSCSNCSGSSLSAKANAADQISSEGATTDPLSMDLSRYLRVAAKQVGTWNINNISGTISLPTGAATQTTLASLLTGVGAPGDTVCGSDTGTCSQIAQVKLQLQHLATMITSLSAAVTELDAIKTSVQDTAPTLIAGRASTTTVTAASDGANQSLRLTKSGAAVTHPFTVPELTFWQNPVTLTDGTETTLIAAGGSGVKNNIISWMACSTPSTTVAVSIDLKDATSGTVRTFLTVPAGGGCNGRNFAAPLVQGTANNAWRVQLSSTPTSGAVRVDAQFVQ